MPIFEVLGAAIDSATSIMKEGVGKTAETAKEGGDKKSSDPFWDQTSEALLKPSFSPSYFPNLYI